MVALLLCGMVACDHRPETVQISGRTMGTSYHITVVADQPVPKGIESSIASVLDRIDQLMSTYKPDSELNKLNGTPVGVSVPVSDELLQVLRVSKKVWEESLGAFDPTVAPLVDLWGFGPVDTGDRIPDSDAIEAALKQIGFGQLKIEDDGAVTKLTELTLDLSAVAKGFAVDRVANWLESQALPRYLVEVGGEVKVSGLNPENRPWRLAIEQPQIVSEVARILEMDDGAIATSGDYRNYFEKDGKRYSHEIDPRTGRPIEHSVASVSVVLGNCAAADAWATALLVLGESGLKLADKLNLPVYMLVKSGEGFKPMYSQSFSQYLN